MYNENLWIKPPAIASSKRTSIFCSNGYIAKQIFPIKTDKQHQKLKCQ